MKAYLRKQILISLCVYIGQILCGYMGGWMTPMIPIFQHSELTPLPDVITDQEVSLISSFLYIGVMFSAVAAGYLSNRKGRKICLIIGGVIAFIAQLVVLFSVNMAMLIVGRTLMGFGIGIVFNQNLVYLVEIASTNIRGILLTGTAVFTSFGTLLSFSAGPYMSYAATCYIGLAISFIFTIWMYFIPESPVFKILQGKETDAEEILKALGRTDGIKDLIVIENKDKKNNYLEIITVKTNRKTLLILIALFILQNLSGSIAIIVYATFIFDLANMNLDPNISTIIFGGTLLVSSFISPFLVERLGRRLLLTLSSALSAIFQTVMGLYFFLENHDYPVVKSIQWLPLVAMIGYFLAFNSGLAIIPSALAGEMFPSEIRSVASAISLTFNWLMGFVMSMTFGFMVSSLGTYITFWMYSGCCATAFVFSIIFVPETKGKSLVEIQYMLNK